MNERYKVLGMICLASMMVPILFTGPALSIPAVAQDFAVSQATLSWIVNAFMVAFGSSVMATGAISDHIGRKRCLIIGLSLFIVTSLGIGFTPSMSVLILLRVIEGIGGAFVITAGMSILAQEFEGTERLKAFSIVGTSFGIGLSFGPMSAGWLIDHIGWRSLYFTIAIIITPILILSIKKIKESKNPDAKHIDWLGILLFTSTLVLFTYGIVEGPQLGWNNPVVITVLAISAGLLVIFIGVELSKQHPMVDLTLFRYKKFVGVQLLPIATGFSFVALLVYLPIWFIVIQGRDPFIAGLAILPLTTPMLVVPLVAGRLGKYYSPGVLSGIGFLIAAIGAVLLTRMAPDDSLWAMSFAMLCIGIGNGIPWGLMDGLAVSVLPKERAGMASGIYTTMRVTGEVVSIAAVGAALIGLSTSYLTKMAKTASVTLPDSAINLVSQMITKKTESNQVDTTVQHLLYNAYAMAFHQVLMSLAILTALTAVICFLILRQRDHE